MQAVLNATDTWFIGRVSPAATAAIGAVYWPVLVFVLLFGGVGLAVQTLVAQAYGGRRYTRASQATWTALVGFAVHDAAVRVAGIDGRPMFAPFDIPHGHLAARSGILVSAHARRASRRSRCGRCWASSTASAGRPSRCGSTLSVAVANALLNQLFMFDLGMGDGGLWLGHRCRAAARRRHGGRTVPGEGRPARATLAPHRAAALARAVVAPVATWDFPWGC